MSPSPSIQSVDEIGGLPNTGNTLAPSASSVSVPPSATAQGGAIFGTRGIAIILGLLFIAGAFLLFLGDDIAGAVRIAKKIAPEIAPVAVAAA
jgi:hypothetical protein